jgi:hypothetical protein
LLTSTCASRSWMRFAVWRCLKATRKCCPWAPDGCACAAPVTAKGPVVYQGHCWCGRWAADAGPCACGRRSPAGRAAGGPA